MSTGLTKFGNVGRVSPDVQAYVNSQIAAAVQPLVTGVGPSIVNGNAIYSDTSGKKIKCTPYTMPTTAGTVGQVLEVDAGGNIVYGSGGPAPPAPTYLPTLTVTSLSQGPSDVVQNYTFPRYPPSSNSLLASNPVAGYTITISSLSSIQFAVERTTPLQAQVFFVPINAGTYIPTDLADALMSRIRAVLTSFNVVADIFIDFDDTIQKFSIVVIGSVVNLNVFTWYNYIAGNNNNDLFGLATLSILLTAASIIPQFADSIPPTLNSSTDLVWRSAAKNQIESDNGASVIECSDLDGIISYGNYNLNNGSLNNIGNINALDNCNITTNTTQIVNGLSQVKLTANNALNTQTSSVDILPAIYTVSQKLGLIEYPRHQITTTNQILYNNTGIEKLRVDNSGVKINNAFYMPTVVGAAGAVLTTNGAGLSSWEIPIVVNPFDQDLNTFNDVVFNSVTANSVDNIGPLSIGSNLASPINIGNAASTTNITGQVGVKVSGNDRLVINNTDTKLYTQTALTGPSGTFLSLNNDSTFMLGSYTTVNGVINAQPNSLRVIGPEAKSGIILTNAIISTSLFNGLGRIDREILDISSQIFKDGNGVERLKVDNTSVTVNNAYSFPTTAGVAGNVLTKGAGLTTTWSDPNNKGLYSMVAPVVIANTITETTIIGGGGGGGSLTIPANTVSVGSAFRYSTGGIFRDNANNTGFRFRLRTAVVLFDSNILTLPNVGALTAWTMTAVSTYISPLTMLTTFVFQFNTGNVRNGFTVQGTGTFDPVIANTFGWTVAWSVASVNNTITSNYGILQKLF